MTKKRAADSAGMLRAVVPLLPKTYFTPSDNKGPVAPLPRVVAAFSFEVAVALAVFSVMIWYFATLATPLTTISSTILPNQKCSALVPKRGTVYYSKLHSENAQFASFGLNTSACVQYLKARRVCDDDNRHDHLTLWGISNPNNSQYYPGGSGYFSCTPTQEPGRTTQLVAFYGTSASFPQPNIDETPFTGSSSAWRLINFAKSITDPYSSYLNVGVSKFLFDEATNTLYNPDPSKPRPDYDLSAASPNSTVDKIGRMISSLGANNILGLGVHKGIYYGLQVGATWNGPMGVAVDGSGNVFVADPGNGRVCRIDTAGVVTTLGTSANPPFNYPEGVAVDSKGNVFVADGGYGVRKIDPTGTVTSLGASANPTLEGSFGVAVDSSGSVYVAENYSNRVRKIDPSGTVKDLGTSANPPFNYPYGIAVDSKGNVYVADSSNNLIRKIDPSNTVTSLGTSANPPFNFPIGVAVDLSGNVFVSDTYNSLIRKIDPSGIVNNLGTSASPSFNNPQGVAVDGSGNVFVADKNNNLVRKIDKFGSISRVGRMQQARIVSWDAKSTDPSTVSFWPESILNDHGINLVDSVEGGCQSLGQGPCDVLSRSILNPVTNRLYLHFPLFQNGVYQLYDTLLILDVSVARTFIPKLLLTTFGKPLKFFAVFNTPINVTILCTDIYCFSDTPDSNGDSVVLYYTISDSISTILDGWKIPGSPSRYLQVIDESSGIRFLDTFDTFTGKFVFYNTKVAATTHYMLAFTWGVCAGNVTRSLVEISFSNDYSNECQLPKTGLYYQSENQYFSIPISCLGIPYKNLLTDCPEVKANMQKLVKKSCAASIPKVCQQQYDLNPPFACVENTYPSPLSVLSLALSNTSALVSFLAVVLALLLSRFHRHYQPSEAEVALSNPNPQNNAKIYKHSSLKQGRGLELSSLSGSGSQSIMPGAVTVTRDELNRRLQSVHALETRLAEVEKQLASAHASASASSSFRRPVKVIAVAPAVKPSAPPSSSSWSWSLVRPKLGASSRVAAHDESAGYP